MKSLKLKRKENYIYLLSFIIPIILMGIIYAVIGIYPFGNKNIITSDMYLQYVAFLSRVKIYYQEMQVYFIALVKA